MSCSAEASLFVSGSYGLAKEEADRKLDARTGQLGRAAASGTAVIINDLKTEAELIDCWPRLARFSSAMEGLGYRVRGECLDAEVPGTPGRFYFSKDQDGRRTHHTHACAVGHVEIADKLAFRDYLRTHPSRAAEYGALKYELARRFRHDNIAYMRG